MEDYPFVTVLIVARNEEEYIKSAVLSVLQQDYPKDKYELLIIDSVSSDDSMKLAEECTDEYNSANEPVQVRFLENPDILLASGWNIGIKNARGEYIVRIDAHAQADRALLKKSAETFRKITDAVCVGGRLKTVPLGSSDGTIARILSSPFGVGNSKFRYSTQSGYTDTIAYGMYKKEIFEKVGFFDEAYCRNQDNEMHGRIKNAGGKFYLNADIENTYHPRDSLKLLLKQAYSNGKWNIIAMRNSKNKKGFSVRHFVPLIFLMANIILAGLSFFFKPALYLFLIMYILYFLSAVFFAAKKTKNTAKIIKMIFYFYAFHICYGAGAFCQLFTQKKRYGMFAEGTCSHEKT